MSVAVTLSDEAIESARRLAGESRSALSDPARVSRCVETAIRLAAAQSRTADSDWQYEEPIECEHSQEEIERILLASLAKGSGVVADAAYWQDFDRRVDQRLAGERTS